MSQIETEHKGYKIVYSENQDVWRCWDLELDAPTLSSLKQKVDAVDLKRRKTEGQLEVFYLESSPNLKEGAETVKVWGVCRPGKSSWSHDQVWVLSDPSRQKGRRKVDATSLLPINEESRKLIAEYFDLLRIASEAEKAARAFRTTLPFFTRAALVIAGGREVEE